MAYAGRGRGGPGYRAPVGPGPDRRTRPPVRVVVRIHGQPAPGATAPRPRGPVGPVRLSLGARDHPRGIDRHGAAAGPPHHRRSRRQRLPGGGCHQLRRRGRVRTPRPGGRPRAGGLDGAASVECAGSVRGPGPHAGAPRRTRPPRPGRGPGGAVHGAGHGGSGLGGRSRRGPRGLPRDAAPVLPGGAGGVPGPAPTGRRAESYRRMSYRTSTGTSRASRSMP